MNKTSKEQIIDKIRAGKPTSMELPVVPHYTFEGNHVESFRHQLLEFGGKYHDIKSNQDIEEYIKHHFHTAKKILSNVAGYGGTVTIDDIKQPKDAADIELAVINGVFGVAETGSVWVTDRELNINSIGLLSLHLILILDHHKIVGNLHEAYELIGKEPLPGYGVFFTGPSATADIEAVHINGAQGVLSLSVLVL